MKRNILIAFLTTGLIFAVSTFGCSPNEEATNDKAQNNTLSFSWAQDAKCEICHTKEASSLNDAQCLASIHSEQGAQCATCHSQIDKLEEVHKEVEVEPAEVKRLKKTVVSSSTCISCHDNLEEIAQTTSETASLTDSEGVTQNPHALSYDGQHGEFLCSSCHLEHESGSSFLPSVEECYQCHHNQSFSCGSCHEL